MKKSNFFDQMMVTGKDYCLRHGKPNRQFCSKEKRKYRRRKKLERLNISSVDEIITKEFPLCISFKKES